MRWDDGSDQNDWTDWNVQHDAEFNMGDQTDRNVEVITLGCDTFTLVAFGPSSTCSYSTITRGDLTVLFDDPQSTTIDLGDPDRAPSRTPAFTTPVGSTFVVSATSNPAPSNNNDGAAEATATTMPSLNASSGGGGDGLSNGAVAGIAIGTAIAGAAIALLVAFLLFKRRNKNREFAATEKYASTPELVPSLGQSGSTAYQPVRDMSNIPPVVAAAAIPHHRSTSSLPNLLGGSNLPAPADEAVITSKISTLFKQIHLHVENFYRDVHASITPSMEPELAKFGMGNTSMTELLQSSSQPTIAIKHALVAYVLGITSADGNDDETLFPKEVAGISAKEQFNTSPDLTQAYTLYKRLAVHLYTASNSTPFSVSLQSSNVREAAEHFALTFFPWANPGYGDQEKDVDLVQIISNALDLMVWLYGQPGTYDFMWDARVDMGRRGTVIAPGLARSDSGERILLEPMLSSP